MWATLYAVFVNIRTAFITLIGKIHWSASNTLSAEQQRLIYDMLAKDHYIVLTRRNNHLSTYATNFTTRLVTGAPSYYSHALMNVENDVNSKDDFRIVEAIGAGVEFTPFDQVFDVNAVVLLKPTNMSVDKWTTVLNKAKAEVGKPYDMIFDISNDNALSCVELVRTALMAEPDYATNFAHFEAMISKVGNNLAPQMFYDCPDFTVAYEIRR